MPHRWYFNNGQDQPIPQKRQYSTSSLGQCDILIHRHLPSVAAALNPHGFAALQLAYKHFSANGNSLLDHHARGHRYTCFGQSANLTQMLVYWLVLLEPLQMSGRWARPQRVSVGQKAALGSAAITVHRATERVEEQSAKWCLLAGCGSLDILRRIIAQVFL